MNRPRLRAPAEQHGLLAVPLLAEAAALLDRNARLLSDASVRIFDTSLPELRQLAQQETQAEAVAFMSRLGMPVPQTSGQGFIVTGHQPELFHPGVWIKNFAAHALARRHGRRSLNIIVDSDLVKANSIRVPNAQGERHFAEFDTGPLQVPYEERHVADEQTFRRFPETVASLMGTIPWQPMLKEFWPTVLAAPTTLLGERLSAGRHTWETQQGCHNLEVPISRLCDIHSFAVFALDLLSNLPRFHQAHNESLEAFRRKHRIRSRHHPVPALVEINGWRELPFWVWRGEQARRSRLFARESAHEWQLAVFDQSLQPSRGVIPKQPAPAVMEWQRLGKLDLKASSGALWKVRSRAITTTLFARLCLSDLFIHGIGGGIYDELTDVIIERYYGLKPPEFLVLSATLRLPWAVRDQNLQPVRALQHRLRNLEFHPERFLPSADCGEAELQREKQVWITRQPQTKEERHERFLTLKQVTAALSERLGERRRQTEADLHQALEAEHREQWRRNREYAFCLYPAAELQQLMRAVS